MKNKLLITINKVEDINKLKDLGIPNFVLPLKDFCVGMPNTFLITDISKEDRKNCYLYVNRILDNAGIDNFKNLIPSLNDFKGIIFDDLGLLELLKNEKIEKILYLSHFNANSKSVNIYLEYVDSVILATDITEREIDLIMAKTNNVSLFVLGYVSAMYSRRLLLDNYSKFYNIKKTNPLKIENTNHEFLVYENEYGTILYHSPIFNGLSLLKKKAKYYFINGAFLSIDIINDLLNGKSDYPSDDGFLHKETIYKLKGDKND